MMDLPYCVTARLSTPQLLRMFNGTLNQSVERLKAFLRDKGMDPDQTIEVEYDLVHIGLGFMQIVPVPINLPREGAKN